MRCSRMIALGTLAFLAPSAHAAETALRAGVAKVDISDARAKGAGEPPYVRALAVSDGQTTVVIVTVDAVAIGGIGPIPNDYLRKVRSRLEAELRIEPANVIINASHCHATVRGDVDDCTVQAVRRAVAGMVPVRVGAGSGQEDRIMENRRLTLKSGRVADVRRAYPLPPDEDLAGIGPVDPEIGVLRLDRRDGRTLALVYQFACHPIQGHRGNQNTSDLVGFASRVIEDNLGDGALALFLQGCGGDINPVGYKGAHAPRDAEPLGQMLGLSTLRAARKVACRDRAALRVINETVTLPRADIPPRIAALEAEQARLLDSLQGTSLNLKAFVPLYVKYRVDPSFPSADAHAYRHGESIGRDDLAKLDAANRADIEQYVANIKVMEELTRVRANLALLKMHLAQTVAAAGTTIDIEVVGLRVGDFVLVTAPGELTVQTGLELKRRSPHELTFISGYTNGYIYYLPTAEQLRNPGHAQEDCDTLVAPGWQAIFEARALEILRRL